MTEKDLKIQQLEKEMRKWKRYARQACEQACDECREYANAGEQYCGSCRIRKIREEAGDA